MYCVALTGGIGSGKSSVAECFARLNIDVISADLIAKNLTLPGQKAFNALVEHFGTCVLNPGGELNRSHLRQIIFTKHRERQWLENLLHPLIRETIAKQVKQSKSIYCVVEIPLLVDKKDYPYLNRVLLVKASKEQQLKRLMARDQSSMTEALAILNAQPDDSIRERLADDQLINEGSLKEMEEKVLMLHQQYLNFAR